MIAAYAAGVPGAAEETPFQRIVADFAASRIALAGLALIAVILAAALFAPFLSPQNPYDLAQLDVMDSRLPPGAQSADGKFTYWLGTDDQGPRHAVGVSGVIFLVLRVIPGDPAQIILGTQATPETLQALRHKLGLDLPLIVQYGNWLGGLLKGDFGQSIQYDVPIASLILSRMQVTVPLAVLSIFFAVLCSIPLGVYAATRRNQVGDYGVMLFSQIGLAIPQFWAGILLILFFAVHLQWFAAEDEGRTEEPTEHKLRKAREEGKVAKSVELASAWMSFEIPLVRGRIVSIESE